MRRSIADAVALVERAERQLRTLSDKYRSSLKANYIDPDLPGDTNDFLNSCRSALDYLAWDIFEEKCKPVIPESKYKALEHRVQFPLKPNRKSFNNAVREIFPDLKKNHLDIVEALRNVQCFGTPHRQTWLFALRKLNNASKHRHLTVQSEQDTFYAKDLQVKFGATSIIMKDTTFVMPKGTVMFEMGDSQVTARDINSHPAIEKVEGNISSDIIFVELRRPVLETLEDIYSGTSNAVTTLIPVIS